MLGELLLFTLQIHSAFAAPYYPNTTVSCNATQPPPPSPVRGTAICETYYPLEIRVMNSRYPDFDKTPLHSTNNFFMLLRERVNTFQIASQVQFNDLPQNNTCRVELQLPSYDLQTVVGPSPIVNVYQVEREAASPARWNTYEAKNGNFPVFAQINGTEEARYVAWKYNNGLMVVGDAQCNETLTFQLGMAFGGNEDVNYWDFIQVEPPATPIQGFRIRMGACW